MKKFLLAATAATALAIGAASPSYAVVCTGTTMSLGNGGTATGAFLTTPGNCVTVSDKIFGEFSVSGAISGQGAAQWSFVNSPGSVTIAFLGALQPNLVGGINYTVAVDKVLAPTWDIVGLEKDLTLNSIGTGVFGSAELTGGVTSPFVVAFDCIRTVNPSGGTCPETHNFAPVAEIDVSQIIMTGDVTATAITDTIIQAQSAPEPRSLTLLGSGLMLMGIGFIANRRRQSAGLR